MANWAIAGPAILADDLNIIFFWGENMAEIETQVNTYRIEYICDECGEGKLEWNGICLTSYPPQYPHSCLHCGATKTFMGVHYPYIATK